MLLFGKPSANRLVNPNLKELVSVPPSKEIELTAVLLVPHTEFGLFYQLPKELLLVSISQLWVNRILLINLGQMQHRMKHLQ
jgi:hypothetical protein